MAFKLAEDTYSWPAVIDIPRDGKHVSKKMIAQFRLLSQSRINAIFEEGDDDDLVDEVLTGWNSFTDAEGGTIEYNEENRAQAIDTPFIRVGLVKAFMESIAGKANRRKN